MEIIDLSHNDDLLTVIRKCNTNFKQLVFSTDQNLKAQGRSSDSNAEAMLTIAVNDLTTNTIPSEVSSQLSSADIPGQVSDAITAADIPGQVSEAIDAALGVTLTTTLSDFFTEDACTVTACSAMKWGSMVFIRFSYRLNSAITVPSNGDITDITLGTLKVGWRPTDITNVILDQTRIIIGDVDSGGVVKARSANSRGTSYTIDANAVLYASMMLIIGIQ